MGSTFVDRLEELGFFKYIAAQNAESVKQDLRTKGWSCIYSETGRLFHSDAEELAEGRIGDFLREIEPFLNRQGITLSVVEDHFEDDGYSLTVNGKTYLIYDADALENRSGRIWGLSTVRTFEIVNGLLTSSGSNERLYAVNGGNDLFGFFLTPELREVICSHPHAAPRDRPYAPACKHPWYGQEHD